MFVKTIYNVKDSRYVPVDWCMSKEDCKVGRYHDETLEAGVSFVLEEMFLITVLKMKSVILILLTLIMNCQQNLTIRKKQLVSFSAMELVKAGFLISNSSI